MQTINLVSDGKSNCKTRNESAHFDIKNWQQNVGRIFIFWRMLIFSRQNATRNLIPDQSLEDKHLMIRARTSGVTTGPVDPASGGRQNRSKIWDIFCKLN